MREKITDSYFWSYLKLLTRFNSKKFSLTISLMVLISLTEGIGLLLLIPLLQLVGLDVQQGALGQIAGIIASFFSYINVKPTLCAVLIIYVIIISLNAFLTQLQTTKSSQIQYGFAADLRKKLFKAISESRWLFFSKKPSAHFAHALTNEIERVSMGTGQFLTLIASIFVLAVYIIFAMQISGPIAGIIFIIGIILLLLLKKRSQSSHTKGEDLSNTTKNLYSITNQHLDGMKTIKSFNMEKRNVETFSNITQGVANKYMETIKSYADVRFLFDVGSVIILSFIVFFVVEIMKISTAELLILLFLFMRIIPRFSTIQRSYQYFINMLPAFVNVINLKRECEAASESEFEEDFVTFNKEIQFKDVSFSYQDTLNIKNLNLKIKKKQITALVGLSGAGKSTTADLVMGLLRPDNGQITIDGLELKNFASWRNQIGYVAQDTFLFNDTVRNNLLLARNDASEAELEDVLEISSADFVFNLPDGLDTMIGDRGVRLSGGERQRLALARALLRKPSLLIMDEATSNLDSKNEKKILESIGKLHGDLTILMIAHRFSTIENADVIYLMEDGHIVEEGSWEEFNEKKGRFEELF
ncbi:MAG: ABC transporter ATP-binding protein [Methanobacteriaceae archaeon]|nr:ABC transporter ATP-binding protein [Methanobacteriaceae archaeon]